MNSLQTKTESSIFNYQISAIEFDDTFIIASFKDGKKAKMPLIWFPKLLNASQSERENYQFIGNGYALYWESLDEDLLAEGFFSFEK